MGKRGISRVQARIRLTAVAIIAASIGAAVIVAIVRIAISIVIPPATVCICGACEAQPADKGCRQTASAQACAHNWGCEQPL